MDRGAGVEDADSVFRLPLSGAVLRWICQSTGMNASDG